MGQQKLAKKITVKEVCGGKMAIRAALKDIADGEEIVAATVYGKVSGAKEGRTVLPDESISEYIRFLGSFRAVPSIGQNAGATYAAPQMILPEICALPIVDALDAAGYRIGAEKGRNAGDGDAEADSADDGSDNVAGLSLEFAMRITVIRDDESAVGYKFGAEPLMEAQEDEGMQRLAALATKAIAPPEETAKPAAGKKAAAK